MRLDMFVAQAVFFINKGISDIASFASQELSDYCLTIYGRLIHGECYA